MLRSRIARVGLAVTVVALAAGVLSTQAGAVSATPPRIVAKPNNLMVNTKTTLTGTGFPAKTKLTIEECSNHQLGRYRKPVRQEQQDLRPHRRTRQVHAAVPSGTLRWQARPEPTSQICYIGDPHPEGVDTMTLLGAAKITVTYP